MRRREQGEQIITQQTDEGRKPVEEKKKEKKGGVRGFKNCSGVLNIKPISSLMKCKYFGESLNWITEEGEVWGEEEEEEWGEEAGGPDSLFQEFQTHGAGGGV